MTSKRYVVGFETTRGRLADPTLTTLYYATASLKVRFACSDRCDDRSAMIDQRSSRTTNYMYSP
ncbi:hypothetical protein E2C01_079291 [Portunus trituberculatus]|uniref:Uncharacterized protein n=1 Tax=Portunus trituberculatus TaxID=210409 RepID=A0A5B7IGK6_PORTR|nr:hypothetical protein [Portunus trituberculatus]